MKKVIASLCIISFGMLVYLGYLTADVVVDQQGILLEPFFLLPLSLSIILFGVALLLTTAIVHWIKNRQNQQP
ncbi:MAG: DUF3955 domain-containing protein [Enterococcus sp.]